MGGGGGSGMGGGMGGGPGGGGPGGGGGQGNEAQPKFDRRQAIKIKGEVESLGSYGLTGWRATPGMAVQGLVLKTEKGNIEVTLGPPGFVAKKGLKLRPGDALEVVGFKAIRNERMIFIAAEVKTKDQTLKLVDERGLPLWRKRTADREGPGIWLENGPGQGGSGGKEPGGMGSGGPGRGGI